MSRIFIKTFLGSDNQTETSIKGPDFTNSLAGHSYVTGYFKNSTAVRIPASLSAGQELSIPVVNIPKEGAMSIWFKPNGWSLSNTTVSPAGVHSVIYRDSTAVPLITWSVVNGAGIQLLFNDGTNPTRVINATTQSIADGVYNLASMSWSTANNLIKIYLNGVEIGSFSGTISLTGVQNTYISLGCRGGINDQELNGDLDLFTYYNYYKTTWNDRNDPRAELGDTASQ